MSSIFLAFFISRCTGTERGWDPPGCPMPSQPDRETERSRPLETWPSGRDLWKLGREAETFGDLAERPRP